MPVAKSYKPVVKVKNGPYSGAALVGADSVIIGWNVKAARKPKNLMGFAVRRTDFDPETGEVLRVDWLNGQKRFEGTDDDFGTDVRSDQAPFQRFRWSDYTVSPGRSYCYKVFPMLGKPSKLKRGGALKFDLRPSYHTHEGIGIYTNRGVTAASAYLQRFRGDRPDDVEDGSAFRWLERGMKKSLLDFISNASGGEALHVCIYEFFDEEVAGALKAAKKKKVDVRIVYHAKSGDKATHESEAVLSSAGLKSVAIPRTNTGHLSHNKFIVHLNSSKKARRLWTASANFSKNAFYFQTNAALVFDKPDLAAVYEEYFQILEGDPAKGRKKAGESFIQDKIEALHERISASPPPPADEVLFSPVRRMHVVETAVALIEECKSAMFLSAPFGVGKEIIQAVSKNDPDVIEFGLANATAKKKIEGLRRRNTRFFTPSRMETYMGRKWDAKAFGNHKIHAKTLVIDPWGKKPAVLIGSANFSEGSATDNDENTLLVRGDKRFAAMIATEFLRMYDHYKIRYWINEMKKRKTNAPLYLDNTPAWADIYFRKTRMSRKFRDRQVFSGGV